MILLVGASASGKTEIAKLLASTFAIRKVVTHTTRPMRQGEVDGVDYHFVDEATFLAMERNQEFVETTFFNGRYYGSSKAEVADDKALIVDPVGLKAYEDLHDPRIVSFYLNTSEALRKERMIARGDKLEAVESRIINDRVAFDRSALSSVDYTLENESASLEDLAKQIYFLYTQRLKD